MSVLSVGTRGPLGYERVYLPLCKVADTPFHIHGNDVSLTGIIIHCPPSIMEIMCVRKTPVIIGRLSG